MGEGHLVSYFLLGFSSMNCSHLLKEVVAKDEHDLLYPPGVVARPRDGHVVHLGEVRVPHGVLEVVVVALGYQRL